MPNDADKYRSWIERIEEEGQRHGLTKWEADFIESLQEQLDEKDFLSKRQAEILEKIYVDRTS